MQHLGSPTNEISDDIPMTYDECYSTIVLPFNKSFESITKTSNQPVHREGLMIIMIKCSPCMLTYIFIYPGSVWWMF